MLDTMGCCHAMQGLRDKNIEQLAQIGPVVASLATKVVGSDKTPIDADVGRIKLHPVSNEQ
jgi:hypothetical protein